VTGEEYDSIVALLERELDGLVRRLRGWSPRGWRPAAGPLGDRSDVAHHVACVLALIGQGAEEAGSAGVPEWREPPRLPVHALADAVTVTGDDAVRALRVVGAETPVWSPAGREAAWSLAQRALGEVLLHRHDLDGAAPGPQASAAAAGGAPADVLATLRSRCPAPPPTPHPIP
jgi:hypothetical protein